MSHRSKWAMTQAYHRTFIFAAMMLVVAAISISGNEVGRFVTFTALASAGLVWLVHVQYYCDMYNVQQISCSKRGVRVEIGHKDAFEDYQFKQYHNAVFIGHKGRVSYGERPIYALLFDNDMLLTVREENHLSIAHDVLFQNWPYYALLNGCKSIQPTMFWSNDLVPFVAEIKSADRNAA